LCAVFSKQSVTEEKLATKKRNDFRNDTCFRCQKRGHVIPQCRVKLKENPIATNVVQKEQSDVQLVNQSVCSVNVHPLFKPYCTAGCIVSDAGERTQLNSLRDTAALQSLLSSRSVPLDALRQLDDVRWIRGISGKMMEIPLVEVWLESDFCNQTVLFKLVWLIYYQTALIFCSVMIFIARFTLMYVTPTYMSVWLRGQ